MQFLYPTFLFALGFIAIPIVIHLFNFRRYKKILFSDIRFLKQLTEQNQKQQTLKNWLVLACRILAIGLLVLAFAQPYIPNNAKALRYPSKMISVFLDNSFSMTALNKQGPLFEIAKAKAKKIAEAYKETDQYQLLTNDFEGKHQRWLSKKDFMQMVDEAEISSTHKKLSEIYTRQNQLFQADRAAQKNSFWISDFQESMIDLKRIKVDSAINLRLVPLTSVIEQNVWIDSVWMKEPFIKTGTNSQLLVRLKNGSETAIENQPLVLKIDGVQKAIQNFSCQTNSDVVVTVNFSLMDHTWHEAMLSITDYPVTFDDSYFLSLKAQDKLEILVLTKNPSENPFKQVFALDEFYKLNTQGFEQINFKAFPEQSLIILNEPDEITSGLNLELTKFITNGGVVLFVPSPGPKDLPGINSFLMGIGGVQLLQIQKQALKVSQMDVRDQLFDKVFTKIPEQANLPEIYEFWQMGTKSSSLSKTIIQMNNDAPFLTHSFYKKGNLFLFASSFNKSACNFSHHALFVPVLLRMPLLAKSPYQLSIILGQQDIIFIDNPDNLKLIKLKLKNKEILFETRSGEGKWQLFLNDEVKTAGVFSTMNQEKEIAKIAFNFNRNESNPKKGSIGKIKESLGSDILEEDISFFGKKIVLEETGTPLWRLALLFALSFLILEILFLRFLK